MLEKRLENATVEVWQEFPCGTRVTHAAFINRDLPEFFLACLVHADGGMLVGVAAACPMRPSRVDLIRGPRLPAQGVVAWLIGTPRGRRANVGLSRARTGGKCTSRYSRLDDLTPVVFVAMGGSWSNSGSGC